MAQAQKRELTREIGLASAASLVVGEVIAVGIFLTPADMAKSLGSPMWLLAVWVAMGAMALSGALCYGELAARFPEAGGGYVYLREAFGPRLAFLYGWMCFLVLDPGITAALAVGLASYAGYIVGLSPVAGKLLGIAAILSLAALNILGVSRVAWLMRWLTVSKLGLLSLLVVWGFGMRLGDWSNFTPFVAQRAGSAPLAGALAGAMVAAFFSFGGWWDLSKVAGEVRDPARTLPRALAAGVVIVTLVYILTSAVFIYLVPIEQVVSGETFAAQAGAALFGQSGGQVFSIIVIVSVLGSLSGVITTAPRVYYAMARDGVFIRSVSSLHPRFGTPARAIALQAGLASLLVAVGTFQQIISYFVFVTVIFIALTVAAVFRLRGGARAETSYLTPGYPVTPLIFLALVGLLLFLLAGHNPRQALLGVGVVAIGAPFYHFVFSRRSTRRDEDR
ncbi:MAG TPA: amino acid permease [Blastocatellia bacterium]|jgi:APA family basic amino acid/polyamine antiporter|nr:amino acid permease [Blastocatellia bacterium]